MQIQPHLFTVLCSIAWIQSMYYPPYSYPRKKFLIYIITFYSLWIGIEVGFSVWLRPLYARGIEWPNLIFGIISTVILAAGLLPPYWELAKRNGRVIGINFLFLALDSSGAIFSMASMCVGTFDPMGMTLYAVIIAMELGLFVSQGIWLLRFRVLSKGKESDDEEEDDEVENTNNNDIESSIKPFSKNEENLNIKCKVVNSVNDSNTNNYDDTKEEV